MERVGGGVSGSLAPRYRKPKNEGVWKPAQQGAGSWIGKSVVFGQAPAPAPAPPTYNGPSASASYFGDPAYELAKAFAGRSRTEAQASALAKRRAAAIQFGDAAGLEDTLGGDYADVAQQAANNPFSVLKNLQHGYELGVRNLEEDLNKANLFYSGYRGDQLSEAAHQNQQANYNARTQFQGLMTDVADQLAAALMQADWMEQQAALNAQLGSFPGYGYGYGPPAPAAPPPQQQQSYGVLPYARQQIQQGFQQQPQHPQSFLKRFGWY